MKKNTKMKKNNTTKTLKPLTKNTSQVNIKFKKRRRSKEVRALTKKK